MSIRESKGIISMDVRVIEAQARWNVKNIYLLQARLSSPSHSCTFECPSSRLRKEHATINAAGTFWSCQPPESRQMRFTFNQNRHSYCDGRLKLADAQVKPATSDFWSLPQ